MKLTEIQAVALKAMDESPAGRGSSYGLKVKTGRRVTVNTMNSLSLKKLVVSSGEPGNMAFPQNADFIITDKGRAAQRDYWFKL